MKKDVIISIRGLQESQGESEDPITLVTAGRFYRKNGLYYITYDETELTGLEGTRTTVKVGPDTVKVIRGKGGDRSADKESAAETKE